MIRLDELLKNWPCTLEGGNRQVTILGVTEYSKRVTPGMLFIARKGATSDGLDYVEEALAKGAVGIVVDRMIKNDWINERIPLIIVPNCASFLAYASATFTGNIDRKLTIIAVTGTNGKTTVTHYIGQLLKGVGVKAAVIGTLGVFVDGEKLDLDLPEMTTLPAEDFHPLLLHLKQLGVCHIVLEASSLGLATHRLDHCEIDVGVLLNIGEDHFDEHGSEKAYIQAKSKLLTIAKQNLLNDGDEKVRNMMKEYHIQAATFGLQEGADFQLEKAAGWYQMDAFSGSYRIDSTSQAPFFIDNIAAACSVMCLLKMIAPKEPVYLTLPEGRMTKVQEGGKTVFIDYAHTPEALEAVLQQLKEIVVGEIIAVFGCGGERHKDKRAKMGRIASQYAKTIILTNDNPRHENPQDIIRDIQQGVNKDSCDCIVEYDRKVAIHEALQRATAQDIVLIAGKGHEKKQIIGHQVQPFSDEKTVTRLLKKFSSL
mgnify:CR=1 FL=1